MSHKGSQIHDVSADEAEVIKWRAQRRLLLRNEYLKEIHNPNAQGGDIADTQLFRLYSTNLLKEKLYNPRPSHFLQLFAGAAVILLTYKFVREDRVHRDHLIRTGQVSYRDREWKFC